MSDKETETVETANLEVEKADSNQDETTESSSKKEESSKVNTL